ncbi:hypothetical protein SLEP1_g13535 [Rubroshorea leprosula]|uniref:Uncharacterized protein n=1 Tax=Rubroshorea leprosula TaxID=152421 RepID=A0AAV5IQB1_9ROSI|nr:hypothetical protein SLEP1_g13535 [Rubroshorea leprosula]
MNSLIFESPSNLRVSTSFFLFNYPSLSRENSRFLHFSYRKCNHFPRALNFSLTGASLPTDSTTSYGGWDDYGSDAEIGNSGDSTGLSNFLASVGIDDKKSVFMFLLGIACALAIYRVRVSKIITFPAFVLVFAVGFSFGFVRGGSFGEVSAYRRRSKDEFGRVFSERMRSLVGFFDGFDVKVNNLRNSIQRAIDSNNVSAYDLENYVNAVESMRLEVLNARNVVEASMDNEGNSNDSAIDNHKSLSKKRKENGGVGFEFSRFLGSLFGERSVGSKSNKTKVNPKREGAEGKSKNQTQGDFLFPLAEERVFASVNNGGKGVSNSAFDHNSLKNSTPNVNREGKTEMTLENGEEYNYLNKRLHFVNESKKWKSNDNLLNPRDVRVRLNMKTEASFVHEEIIKKSSGAYGYFDSREKREKEVYGEKMNYEDDSFLAQADGLDAHESEVGSSTSKFADDVLFDKYLVEANDLLTEAKDCMRGRHDEECAELMLNRCAKVLLKANAMKPMSLLAVGQLGNTYLLHGELKLYISRELRTLLSRTDAKISERQERILKGFDDQFTDRDGLVSLLLSVCQECEELLVKAGRKYRLALSIDGNDVRSLYNWGLALFYRAQLIADIGPEAASDADQVFLAAIDKFDAMMSKGNIYAPDALYRWGVTLQQRSRLRPSNSKEKIKLLRQAKLLYEDALDLDSENVQVREALSSCVSELKYRYF